MYNYIEKYKIDQGNDQEKVVMRNCLVSSLFRLLIFALHHPLSLSLSPHFLAFSLLSLPLSLFPSRSSFLLFFFSFPPSSFYLIILFRGFIFY